MDLALLAQAGDRLLPSQHGQHLSCYLHLPPKAGKCSPEEPECYTQALVSCKGAQPSLTTHAAVTANRQGLRRDLVGRAVAVPVIPQTRKETLSMRGYSTVMPPSRPNPPPIERELAPDRHFAARERTCS